MYFQTIVFLTFTLRDPPPCILGDAGMLWPAGPGRQSWVQPVSLALPQPLLFIKPSLASWVEGGEGTDGRAKIWVKLVSGPEVRTIFWALHSPQTVGCKHASTVSIKPEGWRALAEQAATPPGSAALLPRGWGEGRAAPTADSPLRNAFLRPQPARTSVQTLLSIPPTSGVPRRRRPWER